MQLNKHLEGIMMKYIMKLNPKYFEYMKNGTKEIEIRLNDDKRKNLKIGDEIIFQKEPELKEELYTTVEKLFVEKSFEDAIMNLEIQQYADQKETRENFLKDLYKFYTKEQENKYGVIAIKVRKVQI